MQSIDAKRAYLAGLLQEEVLAVSPAQKRLWIREQIDGPTTGNTLSVGLRLWGPLNIDALNRALVFLVERHEAMRTTFHLETGDPIQMISAPGPSHLPLADLSGVREQDREPQLFQLIQSEIRIPFDLARGSLWRVKLYRLNQNEHVLVCAMHHIISDGWSLGILVRELAEAYRSFSELCTPALPDLAIQYADYTEWRSRLLTQDLLKLQTSYWTRKLRGAPSLLALPADRARPARQTFEAATHFETLPGPFTSNLRLFAQQHNATLFMVMLAALQALLHRYTGQDDILIGVPVSGRGLVEVEGLIGFFVNTLVMRGDASGDPSFLDFLSQVRDTVLDACANQDVPFERVIEALNPERSLSYEPVFQVMFSSVPAPVQSQQFGNLTMAAYPLPPAGSRFDLAVFLIEMPAGVSIQVDYNIALFDSGRIARMLGHLRTLLEGVLADPAQSLSALPLLTSSEAEEVIVWNSTFRPMIQQSVPELFDRQVDRTPEGVALIYRNLRHTYSDLRRRADRLAKYLVTRGVGPGVLVGVYLNRSDQMVIGLLAILRAGAAYVPLDPSYPAQRISYVVQDSGIEVVLTETRLLERLPVDSAQVLCIDHVEADQKLELTLPPVATESPAYVIYTSGSTGKPKGVSIPHKAVSNVLCAMRRLLEIDVDDRLLAITTLSFDIAVLELFLPLISGATVVIADAEAAADGSLLLRALSDHRITTMQATPATWRILIDSGWTGSPPLKVLCGGEALSRSLANELAGRSESVWNLYGPTETTIWSAACRVVAGHGPVPIGRPIDNTEFHVLGRRLEPVPIGVSGELYIGGEGLALGYLNSPELTRQRFIPDPHNAAPGARLYKTGDLVRYLPSGQLQYLGRTDTEVKLRGYRIDLTEIEAVILQYSGVAQAAAVVREQGLEDRRLLAYVVGASPNAVDQAQLRAHLKRTLPAYMIPALVMVDDLPRTPNNKLDRRSLPETQVSVDRDGFIQPRNATEQTLADMWAGLLKVSRVSVTSSFFDLGGHSLLAIALMVDVEQAFGRRLPASTLFHNPTIEYLAECLEECSGSTSSLAALNAKGSKPPFFIGGSNPVFIEIARHLGPDQPVYKMDLYALQEKRLMAGLGPHTDFESMVAEFVRDIRAVEPSGPYYLGGACYGGIVALEAARQLEARGESVALLLVWQSRAPSFFRRGLPQLISYLARRTLSHLKSGGLLEIVKGKVSDLKATGRFQFGHHILPVGGPQFVADRNQQHSNIWDAVWNAVSSYSSAAPHAGRIVYLCSDEQVQGFPHVTDGWQKLCTGGLEVHSLPGDHFAHMNTFLPECAEAIRLALANASDPSQRREQPRSYHASIPA